MQSVSASSVSFPGLRAYSRSSSASETRFGAPGPAETPGIGGIAHIVIASAITPNSTTIYAKAGPRLVGNDGSVGCSGEQREGGLYLVSGRGYQLVKGGMSLSSGL